MNLRQVQEKVREENLYQNANAAVARDYDTANQDIGMGVASSRRASLREESEKSAFAHREQAEKAERSAAFFREHPEFDEFIQLIRQGVIGI